MSKIISKGAEAEIVLNKNIITKNRIPKTYRLKILDDKIRESRTKKEAKILTRAKEKNILVPKLIKQNKFSLELEYIGGDKLSEKLNNYSAKKQSEIMKNIGIEVSKLHKEDIIHGDLTTSNIILKNNKIYIIDFGLGFISKRIEDRAVDIYLIKRALEAKHYKNHEKLFDGFLLGYKINNKEYKEITDRLKKVETRGRYKH